MNLGMEDVLYPLYEVELKSYLDEFSTDMDPQLRSHYEEILVDSLTNIKNFMSSFGATVQDFFNQDKRDMSSSEMSGKKGKGKEKGTPTGEVIEGSDDEEESRKVKRVPRINQRNPRSW